MIDLEDALARIVELAPEPPDVDGVSRRARQRRSRRRGAAIAAMLIVIIGIGGAIALRPTHDRKRVVIENPTTESVRVTMLDGSHLEISGPPSLGLTKLVPVFNGALINTYKCVGMFCPVSHSFSVVREPPGDLGAEVGRYRTGDGHQLVVYSTTRGVDAVVRYAHWALVVSWNHDRANWQSFGAGLTARENDDGFLVITPLAQGWHLGPTDAPDVQLGGTSGGGEPKFSFFGPRFYRSGCPAKLLTSTRTPQGWRVGVGAVGSRFWCDDKAHMRVVAWDPNHVEDAIRGLRVRRL
jgi:hypothetical protein